MSIHLNKPFNDTTELWFSSNNKINGTGAKNWTMQNNITQNTKKIILTDNIILGNFIKETLNSPLIAFQNISNSYMILKEIEKTNVQDITFVLRAKHTQNLDYIINRVFRDLIPLGYNLDIKYINEFKELFENNYNNYTVNKVA